MALHQQTVNVTAKGGSLRATGRATWDSTHSGALLVSAVPQPDADDRLKRSGTTAAASIDAGVVTVDVDAPLTGAGTIPVVLTLDW